MSATSMLFSSGIGAASAWCGVDHVGPKHLKRSHAPRQRLCKSRGAHSTDGLRVMRVCVLLEAVVAALVPGPRPRDLAEVEPRKARVRPRTPLRPHTMARLASFSVVFLAGAAQGYSLAAAVPQQQQHAQRSSLSIAMVSRRTAGLAEQVDQDKLYQPAEAVALMKKLASAKFVETAELHGNLNLDPKYNDQQIRTTASLPHGTGNAVRVAVLAEGAAADAAKEAGADLVGFDDLIETIAGGTLDFDVLLATPPAMPKLAKLGKVLGPKGLMPSPKAGTVSATPGEAVAEFKAGKLEFRTDKQGIVHVPFGKVSAWSVLACVCVLLSHALTMTC